MSVKNWLQNPGFEEGYSHVNFSSQQFGEIVSPDHWLVWWSEKNGYRRPETKLFQRVTDPRRVRSGQHAMQLFTSFGKQHCGVYQIVEGLPPGAICEITAFAHAWSSHQGDLAAESPHCSTGVGCGPVFIMSSEVPPLSKDGADASLEDRLNDAIGNFTFQVGVGFEDPNPFSSQILWGPGASSYNDYSLPVQCTFVVPPNGKVVVYARSISLWAYNNSDGYWDDFSLVVVEESEKPFTQSKLGLHILKNSGGVGEFLQQSPAAIVYDGEWGMSSTTSPNTKKVGVVSHTSFDAQSLFKRGFSPEDAAQYVFQADREKYLTNPDIEYWGGFNEPVLTKDQMVWYSQEEIARINLLTLIGKKALIGEFSTGCPELPMWEWFLPALRYGAEHGALLGLHEYSCPWMWWLTGNHQIDPSEDQGDEGWLTLRYRKVYRQWLEPNNIPIQILITECGLDPNISPQPADSSRGAWKDLGDFWLQHDHQVDKNQYYFEQLKWYDEELCKDNYVVGGMIFCAGNFGGAWATFDVADTPVITLLTEYLKASEVNPPIPPTPPIPPVLDPDRGLPRTQYERTYLLLSPEATGDWVRAVGVVWDLERYTLGNSADDAGIGNLDCRNVLAVNPKDWGDSLEGFFDQYYRKVNYSKIEANSPADLAIQLLPESAEYKLSQRNPFWSGDDLGECPGGDTIGDQGCFLTDFDMMLIQVYKVALIPPILNRLLADAEVPFFDDDVLGNWTQTIELFSKFDSSVKIDQSYSPDHLREMWENGWKLILRVSNGRHFVYLDEVIGDSVYVIDPLKGERVLWPVNDISGIRGAHEVLDPNQPPTEPEFTLRGVHDWEGGHWLKSEGLQGWCVIPLYLGTAPMWLPDLADLKEAGIRTILNLRYSYAVDDGGQGTMPGPDKIGAFESACLQTIEGNPDAWGFIYGNEMNNPREWPEGFQLTPEYYLNSYLRVRYNQVVSARLSPGAIDPYNGGWGDWRQTWKAVLEECGGDFVALHAYTHGSEPERVWSTQEFQDAPLEGVFYELKVLENQMAILPGAFSRVPIIVSETNHLFKFGGTVGWDDGEAWVIEAFKYFKQQGISGACLFRFNHDRWNFKNSPQVLAALKKLER